MIHFTRGTDRPTRWPSLDDDIEDVAVQSFEYGTAMRDVADTVRQIRAWFVEKPKKARRK